MRELRLLVFFGGDFPRAESSSVTTRSTLALLARAAGSPSYGSWANPCGSNSELAAREWKVPSTVRANHTRRQPPGHPTPVLRRFPLLGLAQPRTDTSEGIFRASLWALWQLLKKPLRVLFKTPTRLNGPTTGPLIYRMRRPVRPAAWPTPPTARPLQSRDRTSRLPGASRRT